MKDGTRLVQIGGAEFLALERDAGEFGSDDEIMKAHWNVQPGDICLDIGFGPGTWTLVALAKGGRTISFDPKPECSRMLTDQIVLNHFRRALVLPFGLWQSTGLMPFGANGFVETDMKREMAVDTLDSVVDWLKPPRVDLVNMDAEWSEREVVRGARKTIKIFRPKIIIEIHDENYTAEIVEEISSLGWYEFWRDRGFLVATPKGQAA